MVAIDKEGDEEIGTKLMIKQQKTRKNGRVRKNDTIIPNKVSFPLIRLHITIILIRREALTRFFARKGI